MSKMTKSTLKDFDVKREIKTKEQFRRLISGLTKKEQIVIPSIEVDMRYNKFKCAFELTRTPLSRIYTKDNVEESIKVRNESRIMEISNKFNWTFLSVSVTDDAKLMSETIFGGSIYLVYRSNGWVKIFLDSTSSGVNFIDLETGEVLQELPKGEIHIYKGLAWTASNKREKTMIFMEVTHGDRRFEVLDEATLGALSILLDKYGLDKSMEGFIALQKSGGYIGNVLTGSIDFGIIEGYVRYYGKFENDTNETFLTKEYNAAKKNYMDAIKSGDAEQIKATKEVLDDIIKSKKKLKEVSTQDGQMYVNARVFAKMIEAKFGIKVDPKVLVGMMIQLRPGTIKASAVILSEDIFNGIVEGAYALAAKTNTEIEPFGDKNNLLFIADKNCIKLDYDVTREMTMQVLAFAKCSEGKTSKQLSETVLFAANELGENGSQLLCDILSHSIDEKVSSLTVDKKVRLLTPEEIDKAVESKYVNDIVMSIAPSFIEENKAFFNSTWRQTINSVTNMIDGVNGALTSHNRRLASDPTFIFTGGKLRGILNTGEVMINNRMINKVVMIKYPKMGLREFYFAKNVDLRTIRKRLQFHVKKGTITQAEADKVAKFYLELDSFVAVLPAKAVIAYACAGLDFDYDGSLFLEYTKNTKNKKDELTNKVIDLLERTKMKAVVIQ